MTENPPVPPPGMSAVFPLPIVASSGGTPELSGLLVAGDGRLTVAHCGAGLAVRLAPEDCTALALLLWQLAGQLAERNRAAAEGADAALARIVQGGATNA